MSTLPQWAIPFIKYRTVGDGWGFPNSTHNTYFGSLLKGGMLDHIFGKLTPQK